MGRPWVDFATLRDRASFAAVLARYNIVPARLTGQVTVLCPFHDDRQPSLSSRRSSNKGCFGVRGCSLSSNRP